MHRIPAILLAVAFAGAAQAQGVIMTHKLSAALANELVGESVADCAKKGYKVVAVVVDLDGVRQAVLRGDGAPIHSMDNAYYKAYSIASLGLARKEETTKAIAERMAKAPATTVPQTPFPMSRMRSAASRSSRTARPSAASASAARPAGSSTRIARARPWARSRTG